MTDALAATNSSSGAASAAAAPAPGLLARIIGLLLRPRQSWQAIAAEDDSIARIYRSHLVWLLLFSSVCSFIASSLVGVGAFGITVRMPIVHGLINLIVGLALALVLAYVMALLANALAPRFGGVAHLPSAFKLLAYSATAALLGSVFQIIPWLGLLGLIAGLYSIYLFYIGVPVLLKVQRAAMYTMVFVLCALVIGLVVGGLVSMVTPGMPKLTSQRGGGTEIRLPGGRTVDVSKLEGLAEQMQRAGESGSAADQASAIGGWIAAVTGAQSAGNSASTAPAASPADLAQAQQAIEQAEQKLNDAKQRGDTRAAADSFGEAMAAAAKAMQAAEAMETQQVQAASPTATHSTPAQASAPPSLSEETGLKLSPETEAALRDAKQRMKDIEARLEAAQAKGDQTAVLALSQEMLQLMQDPAILAASQEVVNLQMQAVTTHIAAYEAQVKAQAQSQSQAQAQAQTQAQAPAAAPMATGANASSYAQPLPAAQLRSLLPEQLAGLPRTRIQVRNQAPEQAPQIELSTLTARYENASQRVQLKLQDVGGPPSVAQAQADWTQRQGRHETAKHHEHIYLQDATVVRESQSRTAAPNRLTLLLPNQLLLELEGTASIEQLHALAQQLNLLAIKQVPR